mmetsp:Transcript_97555/g.281511  ORF Transcript_97555/g.281511 Transcript_97555/m.281511 type:complete len:383 (+) Transcript_97555:42-1190(+)
MPSSLWVPGSGRAFSARVGRCVLPLLWPLALLFVAPASGRLGFQLTDLENSTFSEFLKANDKVLVDFYDPADPAWTENSRELQSAVRDTRAVGCDVEFAKVNVAKETGLAQRYCPNGPFPQLMWFQHAEPTQYHRRLRKAKQIVDFVTSLDRSPVTVADSEEWVRQSANRAVFARFPKASPMYHALEVVASKHMDTVLVCYQDTSGFSIQWFEEGKEGAYDGEQTVQALDTWVRHKLTKSEPLPEPQEGDSVIVVGQTFEEIVLRGDKDVFLLVYAPWCGFSRKFIPTWEALAHHTKSVSHLLVAKMDGDLNDSPYPEDFSWRSYPTVFFLPAGKRQPVVFHGNRTIANLLAFARKHGSKELPAELDAADTAAPDREDEWEL